MSQHAFHERGQVTVAIKCHWCGNVGSTVWEKTDNGREVVTFEGFYERLKKKSFQIETVCSACDRAQPI